MSNGIPQLTATQRAMLAMKAHGSLRTVINAHVEIVKARLGIVGWSVTATVPGILALSEKTGILLKPSALVESQFRLVYSISILLMAASAVMALVIYVLFTNQLEALQKARMQAEEFINIQVKPLLTGAPLTSAQENKIEEIQDRVRDTDNRTHSHKKLMWVQNGLVIGGYLSFAILVLARIPG
jgi:hypothetical protein